VHIILLLLGSNAVWLWLASRMTVDKDAVHLYCMVRGIPQAHSHGAAACWCPAATWILLSTCPDMHTAMPADLHRRLVEPRLQSGPGAIVAHVADYNQDVGLHERVSTVGLLWRKG
jgi:hypothetical protein